MFLRSNDRFSGFHVFHEPLDRRRSVRWGVGQNNGVETGKFIRWNRLSEHRTAPKHADICASFLRPDGGTWRHNGTSRSQNKKRRPEFIITGQEPCAAHANPLRHLAFVQAHL